MNFTQKLTGGHPNSLGNTIKVVDEVLANHSLFDELFHCYFSDDEVVRLRTSSAVKRVAKVEPEILIPYLNRFLEEISLIDQASTKWTLSELFDLLKGYMNAPQKKKAKKIMQNNLSNKGKEQDWIVLNTTIKTLTNWAREDEDLKKWLLPHLAALKKDRRKSVSRRAEKMEKALA